MLRGKGRVGHAWQSSDRAFISTTRAVAKPESTSSHLLSSFCMAAAAATLAHHSRTASFPAHHDRAGARRSAGQRCRRHACNQIRAQWLWLYALIMCMLRHI